MNMTATISLRQRGFTMTELMVSLVIFALLITGSLSVFIMGLRLWHTSSMDMDTMREASMGIEQMLYGATTNSPGLRQASATNAADPFKTVVTTNTAGWNIRFVVQRGAANITNSFGYAKSSGMITNQSRLALCTNVNQSSITMISNNQVSIYIRVTNSLGRITRTNDLTTSVFFRN